MQELSGKVAVVTGAGSGIGRAMALAFAAEGMSVALADIDGGAAEETAALVAAAAPGVTTLPRAVDVSDGPAVEGFADEVFDTLGQADVLCLNAGVFVGGVIWEVPAVEIDHILGVNLHGILNGARSFLPRMIAQDTEGHVVTTASVAGLFGSPFSGPYGISKFAAFAAGETIAHDLAATGSKLRASVLCPGIIKTDIANKAARRDASPGATPSDAQQFVNGVLVDVVNEHGIDPSLVAERVVDAIFDEQFLILTHDHHADAICDRAETLANLELPPIVDYT